MDGSTIREAFDTILSRGRILKLAEECEVEKRGRKRDLELLARTLVMVAGSDDSGRIADAYSAYLTEADEGVVRGAFYAWFSPAFAAFMTALTREALSAVAATPARLTGGLVGVDDWHIVDSETVTLRDALAAEFPATSTDAGLKIHKRYSLGRQNVVDFKISPARDHDSPHLVIDESWRGLGLLVDLGYARIDLIKDCYEHGVELVMRLKGNWKPQLLRTVVDGTLIDVPGKPRVEDLLKAEADEFGGKEVDLDVLFGCRGQQVPARVVGVPGEQHYHWCITTLPRETHPPHLVCELYRTRWEIELDNRRDKGAARLDQIRATSVSSVMALIHASILRTILANHIVHLDSKTRPVDRAPLHPFALSLCLCTVYGSALRAMTTDDPVDWAKLARVLYQRGHDPNWRSRPSVTDRLNGTTAPRGRPKRARLRDGPPSAASFRRWPTPQTAMIAWNIA